VPSAAKLFAIAAAFLALLAPAAHAQVLYKWVDSEGRVQYSDHPPKDAQVPVTRIEPDAAPTVAPVSKSPPPVAESAKAIAPPTQDVVAKRRANRAALEGRLELARAALEAARRSLADASSPEPTEQQVFQQPQNAGAGGMHGLSQSRSNCRPAIDKNGKAGVMCAAVMPNEAYFERVAKLEEAVRKAEEELADAESAWRRGVD